MTTFSYEKGTDFGHIEYTSLSTRFILDLTDLFVIINVRHQFIYSPSECLHPYYNYNTRKITIVQLLFNVLTEDVRFKNGNVLDLRRNNIEIVEVPHHFDEQIRQQYTVVRYIKGHTKHVGKDSGVEKNPIWVITCEDKEELLMYCEKNTLCRLCWKSYQIIQEYEQTNSTKLTWYKCDNGYIQTHVSGNTNLYIHQIITNCYGNGYGTANISVDHVDQTPLNNIFDNLRIATRQEQEQNTNGIKEGTKRNRQHNAQPLPEGITQEMLGKYVIYRKEEYNKEIGKTREFFYVDKNHPKLLKPWESSKSNKISLIEKLGSANKVSTNLYNNIYPEEQTSTLPKYMTICSKNGRTSLVYDRKLDSHRYNMKMVLLENYILVDEIPKMNEKIREKYPNFQ